jgi:hypothetical protein
MSPPPPPAAVTVQAQDTTQTQGEYKHPLKVANAANATHTAKNDYSSRLTEPLTYSGSLNSYKKFNHTPTIGLEIPDLQLTDILNDDTKLRDLAILVSQRGVVFFRNQKIDSDDQKVLGQKLGELTGKPESSKVCTRHKILKNQMLIRR